MSLNKPSISGGDTCVRKFGQVTVTVTTQPIVGAPAEWADPKPIAQAAIDAAVAAFQREYRP